MKYSTEPPRHSSGTDNAESGLSPQRSDLTDNASRELTETFAHALSSDDAKSLRYPTGCIDMRRESKMLEQVNVDRDRVRYGVRLSISLLVAALIAVGCGSNATDERSVEDYSDAGAIEADEQPDPGLASESSTADDEMAEEVGDDEEVAVDTPRPSLPVGPGAAGPDADDSPPAFFDDRIIAADLWGAELAILSAEWVSRGDRLRTP